MSMKLRRAFAATTRCRLRPFVWVVAVGLLALASKSGAGAAVYRWVDEQGKVHYAEVVPQRYQGVARRMDAAANEPSADQRREALERAQQLKAKAGEVAIEVPSERRPLPASTPTAAAASQPSSKRPAQIPNDQTDCKTWQRLYLESIECFGPFRTVRGATKPEAFEVCNVVTEPPPTRCRLIFP